MNQRILTPTQQLIQILNLSTLHPTRFLGQSVALFGTRVFGGQILAQAIMAAAKTCDRPVNSLHGYFIRPGHSDYPIEYQVTMLRDGQKFSLRQVHAYQEQQLIFSALISMSIEYGDFDSQVTAPAYPMQPKELKHQYAQHFHLQIEPQQSDPSLPYYEYAKTAQVLCPEYDSQLYHQAIAA